MLKNCIQIHVIFQNRRKMLPGTPPVVKYKSPSETVNKRCNLGVSDSKLGYLVLIRLSPRTPRHVTPLLAEGKLAPSTYLSWVALDSKHWVAPEMSVTFPGCFFDISL